MAESQEDDEQERQGKRAVQKDRKSTMVGIHIKCYIHSPRYYRAIKLLSRAPCIFACMSLSLHGSISAAGSKLRLPGVLLVQRPLRAVGSESLKEEREALKFVPKRSPGRQN